MTDYCPLVPHDAQRFSLFHPRLLVSSFVIQLLLKGIFVHSDIANSPQSSSSSVAGDSYLLNGCVIITVCHETRWFSAKYLLFSDWFQWLQMTMYNWPGPIRRLHQNWLLLRFPCMILMCWDVYMLMYCTACWYEHVANRDFTILSPGSEVKTVRQSTQGLFTVSVALLYCVWPT